MPSQSILLRWPVPEPNYVWRPWLEEHVGKQGIDWQWWLRSTDGYHTFVELRIIPPEKAEWLVAAALMWS